MSPATSSAEATGTLKKGLHQEGRRMTPQRRLVLDLFEQIGSGSHLSAEEVHRQLVDNQHAKYLLLCAVFVLCVYNMLHNVQL